jgi:hypothetical protein
MAITIDGALAEPWLYRPDGVVLERLEWLTDIVGGGNFDGSEQRVQLRQYPRRFFDFAIGLLGRDRRTAENLLHAWQAKPFALPVWMDAQTLAAPGAGSTIAVDTTTRDFVIGGLVGVGSGPHTYEIREVQSMTAASLTFTAPLASVWPAGTEVYPLRSARLPDDQRVLRFDGDTAYGRFRFECTDNSDWPAATGEPTYRTFPVLTTAPNWTEDVEQGYLAKLAVIDPTVGRRYYDPQATGSITLQTHRWLLDGRAQIDAFRQWLYARRGRAGAFWLPTFALDFAVVANIGVAAVTIDVQRCGYTDFVAQDIGRRDIRIQLLNGTVYYRRITGSVNVSGTVERLSIDSALGALVTPAEIRSVSFMDLVRLEGDSAEIAWWRSDVAESRLTTRGSRNNL